MVCTKVTKNEPYKAGWTEAVMETPQEAVDLEQLYLAGNEELYTFEHRSDFRSKTLAMIQ